MEESKKKLNKTTKTNMLSTYYSIAASCSCGRCGCNCTPGTPSFNSFSMDYIESGYRDGMSYQL